MEVYKSTQKRYRWTQMTVAPRVEGWEWNGTERLLLICKVLCYWKTVL